MPRNRAPSRQTRKALEALLSQPTEWCHGYDLCKLSGLSSGTLYPLLIRLHERGLLEARWIEPDRPGRPARHAYRLSSAGVDFARSLQTEANPVVEGREALA
jgi:DNA-binding PadR family transcriptional regulator